MKKLLLALAAMVVTLVLAEVALRITGAGPLKPGLILDKNTAARIASGVMVADPVFLWREAKPGLDYDRPDRFLRPRETMPARDGKPRVLCLGDSCTRLTDAGVPYSLAMERFLAGAEVYNASLPGYTTYQGRAWLERGLLDLAPDVVVIYFGWNDHWRSTGFRDRELAHLLRPTRLRLLNLLVKPHQPPPLRVAPDDYAANLRAMIADLRARGAQPVLVLAPHHITAEAGARLIENGNVLPDDDPTGLHEEYLTLVRQVGDETGADVVDAAGVYAAIASWPELLMRDGIHPTQIGHLVLAAVLAQHIRDIVPGLGGREGADLPVAWSILGEVRRQQGHWPAALAALHSAVEAAPADPVPRVTWAWALATCPVDSLRDGARALAALADQPPSADVLDVRAAAHAAAGEFDAAIRDAEAAIAALGDSADTQPRRTALQKRVDQYRQHRTQY